MFKKCVLNGNFPWIVKGPNYFPWNVILPPPPSPRLTTLFVTVQYCDNYCDWQLQRIQLTRFWTSGFPCFLVVQQSSRCKYFALYTSESPISYVLEVMKKFEINEWLLFSVEQFRVGIFILIIYRTFSLVCNWSKYIMWPNIPRLKLGNFWEYSPIFKLHVFEEDLKDNKDNSLHLARKYDRIFKCPWTWSVPQSSQFSESVIFLELRSQKTVHSSEQVMSADKYTSIFSRQMEAVVYI